MNELERMAKEIAASRAKGGAFFTEYELEMLIHSALQQAVKPKDREIMLLRASHDYFQRIAQQPKGEPWTVEPDPNTKGFYRIKQGDKILASVRDSAFTLRDYHNATLPPQSGAGAEPLTGVAEARQGDSVGRTAGSIPATGAASIGAPTEDAKQ